MRKPNMAKEQTPSSMLSMEKRTSTFEEAVQRYTLEEAKQEAERCLNCPDKFCTQYCPAHNYIPEFIAEIRNGNLKAAWDILSTTNPLMEISGRVCPYENQCESHCTRSIKCEAVAIGKLERFVADWYRENIATPKIVSCEPIDKSVAVVGAGPAGITCAISLREAGFDVTIYEATDRIGGVAAWGIPEFVLPRTILENYMVTLRELGVTVQYNTVLGKDIALDELNNRYDAVFIATGAQIPKTSALSEEKIAGVVQAKEYLSNYENYNGKQVVVIGGGNTAIDAARVALRRGAEKVTLVYRRTNDDMPVTKAELALAEEEGMQVLTLLSPSALESKDGKLTGMVCSKMDLTSPDYPGGRNNVAPSKETVSIDCDLAIFALGFSNEAVAGVEMNAANQIIIDKMYRTSLENVYAGGDAVTGPQTLMKAAAAGKEAACQIFSKLSPL